MLKGAKVKLSSLIPTSVWKWSF